MFLVSLNNPSGRLCNLFREKPLQKFKSTCVYSRTVINHDTARHGHDSVAWRGVLCSMLCCVVSGCDRKAYSVFSLVIPRNRSTGRFSRGLFSNDLLVNYFV